MSAFVERSGLEPLGVQPPFKSGWRDMCAKLENIDMMFLGDSTDRFRGWVCDSALGDMRVRKVGGHGGPHRAERSAARINHYKEELIWICLVVDGEVRITYRNQPARLAAGDFVFLDASQPYCIDMNAEPLDTLWVGCSRPMAERQIWDIDEVLGVRIDGSAGAGRIASQVMRAALSDMDDLNAPSATRLGGGLMTMLGCAADHARLTNTNTNYRNATIRRIKTYIEQRLSDETLSVARIAQDNGLSPRYLAKMFESETLTVSAWIWERRLARCHDALVAAAPGASVTEIAFDHGFKNISHFCRVFRERYGCTPKALLGGAWRPLS